MRRHAPRTSSPRRRKLVWSTQSTQIGAIAAAGVGQADVLLPLKVVGASLLGVTIMRTHLVLGWTGVGSAVNDRIRVGLIVATDTDVSAGPSATPEADWMWNSAYMNTWSGAAPDSQQSCRIDCKSKRRLEELQETYLLVINNLQTQAITVQVLAHTLLALP